MYFMSPCSGPTGQMAGSSRLLLPSCFMEFEVEQIVDHRTLPAGKAKRSKRSCKTEYLVHWLGYHSTHDMWLPEADLTSIRQRIDEYWARSKAS